MLYEGLNISNTVEFDRLAYKQIALAIAADATFIGSTHDFTVHNALEEEFADEVWAWAGSEVDDDEEKYLYLDVVSVRAKELYDRYADRSNRGVVGGRDD